MACYRTLPTELTEAGEMGKMFEGRYPFPVNFCMKTTEERVSHP